jgi:hypothetical protein
VRDSHFFSGCRSFGSNTKEDRGNQFLPKLVVELIPPNVVDVANHIFWLTTENGFFGSPLEIVLFSPPHLHDLE